MIPRRISHLCIRNSANLRCRLELDENVATGVLGQPSRACQKGSSGIRFSGLFFRRSHSVPRETGDHIARRERQQPSGRWNYGSAGAGSISTRRQRSLTRGQTGIDMTRAPDEGAAPVLTDLVGKQVRLMISPLDAHGIERQYQAKFGLFYSFNARHQGRRQPRSQSGTTLIGVPWMPKLGLFFSIATDAPFAIVH